MYFLTNFDFFDTVSSPFLSDFGADLKNYFGDLVNFDRF